MLQMSTEHPEASFETPFLTERLLRMRAEGSFKRSLQAKSS
jgi:hypothetical protein